MSKVFVNIALSLDGYMAPEGMALENWGAKWGARHDKFLKRSKKSE